MYLITKACIWMHEQWQQNLGDDRLRKKLSDRDSEHFFLNGQYGLTIQWLFLVPLKGGIGCI